MDVTMFFGFPVQDHRSAGQHRCEKPRPVNVLGWRLTSFRNMWGLNALVSLLFSSFLANYAIKALSTFGLRFLIAIPKVDESFNEEVHFLLGTMATKIKVEITTNWKKGDRLDDSVLIRRSRVTRYIVGKTFLPKEDGISQSWTYEFNSEASFTLTVVMIQPSESVASFLAYPLSVWSKQYSWSVYEQNPTFHIVTLEETQLNLKIDGSYMEQLSIQINNKTYNASSLRTSVEPFKIESRSSFMFSFCSFTKSTRFLVDMNIEVNSTEPIGIISGNCKSNWTMNFATCSVGERLADSKLEMILPLSLAGTDFIYWNDIPRSRFISVFGRRGTVVNTEQERYTIIERGETRFQVNKYGVLKASLPVIVMQEVFFRCEFQEGLEMSGDVSWVILLPNSLFYVFYMWRSPVLNIYNKLSLVVETAYVNTTILDDLRLDKKIEWAPAGPTYSVAIFVVLTGSHTIRSNGNRKFGCYISGVSNKMGHAHPAGFSSCVHKGTGTDEDVCVGGTDEETYTPGLRESELNYKGIGSWGQWGKWTCSREGVQIRTRVCQTNMVCKGMFDDISNDPCKKKSCGHKICVRGTVLVVVVSMFIY